MQPERVERMSVFIESLREELIPAIKDLAVNMKSHIGVMTEIKTGMHDFNKTVKKLGLVLSKLFIICKNLRELIYSLAAIDLIKNNQL